MPTIPAVKGTCPMLVGLSGTSVTFGGQTALIWSGTKQTGGEGAPLLFYWHGTGIPATEVQGTMAAQIPQITGAGGLVASFSSTYGTGTDTSGDGVFFADDFNTADQILACAVQQLNIDVHRLISAGCSTGGLQTGSMLYLRSGYLACAMPNSGGASFPLPLQDKHVPSLITTHGAMGSDVVVIDFSTTSATEDKDVKSKGGFVVDCNHGGGHCGAPANDIAAQWKFCMDHPFGVTMDPYAGGLPSSFPTYCKVQ
jgi:predicted esterase